MTDFEKPEFLELETENSREAVLDQELMIRLAFMLSAYLVVTVGVVAGYFFFGAKIEALGLGIYSAALSILTLIVAYRDAQGERQVDRKKDDSPSPHYIPTLDPNNPQRVRASGQHAVWLSVIGGAVFAVLAAIASFAGISPLWHVLLAASLITFSPLIVLFFV